MGSGQWKPADLEAFAVLTDHLERDLEVVFVVPGWARVHMSVCGSKFSSWWK